MEKIKSTNRKKQNKKKNIPVRFFFILFCFILSLALSGCWKKDDIEIEDYKDENTSVLNVEENKSNKVEINTNPSDEETIGVASDNTTNEEDQKLVEALLKVMKEEENVKKDCKVIDDTLYFQISEAGNTDIAFRASKGDKNAVTEWNRRMEIYKNAESRLYEIAKQNGLGDRKFRFNVLNDKDKSGTNALVVFENDVLYYDLGNNIDKMEKTRKPAKETKKKK